MESGVAQKGGTIILHWFFTALPVSTLPFPVLTLFPDPLPTWSTRTRCKCTCVCTRARQFAAIPPRRNGRSVFESINWLLERRVEVFPQQPGGRRQASAKNNVVIVIDRLGAIKIAGMKPRV